MPQASAISEGKGRACLPIRATYTGKDINATASSRNSIATALTKGAVLVADPYGHDTDKGADYTQPQTGWLHMPKGVVARTPSASTGQQEVELAPVENGCTYRVLVDGSGTNIAVGDLLKVQNGSFQLVKATELDDMQATCFIALEASTSAGDLIDAIGIPGVTKFSPTALTALTDNSGGTANNTLEACSTAVTGVDGTGNNAASKTDVNARLVSISNNFADLAAKVNEIRTILVNNGLAS